MGIVEELVSKIQKTYIRNELYQAEKIVPNYVPETSLKKLFMSWYKLRLLNKEHII